MKVQVTCPCGQVFWSSAIKNKLKEVVALRVFCRKCENRIRHKQQISENQERAEKRGQIYIGYDPQVRLLEGIDERNLMLAALAQIERERKEKEKRDKGAEQKRYRAEGN